MLIQEALPKHRVDESSHTETDPAAICDAVSDPHAHAVPDCTSNTSAQRFSNINTSSGRDEAACAGTAFPPLLYRQDITHGCIPDNFLRQQASAEGIRGFHTFTDSRSHFLASSDAAATPRNSVVFEIR